MSARGGHLLVLAGLTGLVSDANASLLRHVERVALPVPLTLQQRVAALEYQPSMQEGVLAAPNRAQGLRLRWVSDGVEVEAREKRQLLAKLQTVGLGRGDAWQGLGEAVAEVEAALVKNVVSRI